MANELATAARGIKATGKLTDKDISFLSLVHRVDIESDVMKGNKKTVTFTMNGSGSGGEVKFANLKEFKSYVKAWEQASALCGASEEKFAVLLLLKRALKKWCDSFIVQSELTSSKASARKKEQTVKFRFKGTSGALITMPVTAVASYVKVLKKVLADYSKL